MPWTELSPLAVSSHDPDVRAEFTLNGRLRRTQEREEDAWSTCLRLVHLLFKVEATEQSLAAIIQSPQSVVLVLKTRGVILGSVEGQKHGVDHPAVQRVLGVF